MADEIIQKRAYELLEYIQLVLGDVGYENPSTVWIALDRAGWPEAKKFSLIQFIDAVIGSNSQYYLNNGEPWVDEAAVLSGFPYASRNKYDTVNIMGVDYWFLADKTTLVVKFGAAVVADNSITNTKLYNQMPTGTLMYRRTAGNGNPEYTTLAQLRTDLNIPVTSEVARQNVFTIKFPTGNVAARCAGVLSLPAGWIVAAGTNPADLVVTHSTGREIAAVKVWAIEPVGKTELYANMAYSGVVASDNNSVTIRGFATIGYAITLHLIFE